MNTDIQDGLSSVAEVGIFAWSLLEVLLTRILPLVGFLAGHVLLQCGSLLSSIVTTPAASRRRRPRASEYSYSWDELQVVEEEVFEEGDNVHALKEDQHSWDVLQAEELAQEVEEKVPVVKKDDDDHQSSSESLTSSNEEHGEISPQISEGKASLLLSLAKDEEAEAAATAAEAALPQSVRPEEHVSTSIELGNEKSARGSNDMDVAESSDAPNKEIDLRRSDIPRNNNLDVAAVEEGHVPSKAEGRTGKINLKPSDTQTNEETTSAARSGEMRKMSGEGAEMRKTRVSRKPSNTQTSEEATSAARSGEMRKMSGDGAEMRKSSSSRGPRSILHVLPHSLSQVERPLRQRSRRVTFAHAED